MNTVNVLVFLLTTFVFKYINYNALSSGIFASTSGLCSELQENNEGWRPVTSCSQTVGSSISLRFLGL